ncbi:hypothetical protein [Kitasatospora fiedleri]|uniref:hypothetical protein n=1 Tax=Kitasatospora fiedleri TaxID=2991545 RepID=UPI00249AB232|nr:hypothetical protein [Kitasatospora fiedleri]
MKPGWRIRRLTDGSATVTRRLGRSFVPLDADGETRLIASGIRIGAGLLLGNGLLTLAHQSPAWLIGGTCTWCWAAWRAGAPTPAVAPQQADEDGRDGEDVAVDDPGDDVEAEPEPLTLAPALLADSIEHMVATRAQSDGGAGNVLLAEALAVLQRHGWYQGCDSRAFGAAVRAAGVPPKPSVAVGSGADRKTSPGWSVAHLQQVFGRPPSLPPQGAVDRTPVEAA